MKAMPTMRNLMMAALLLSPLGASADELLAGPYRFDPVGSVHVKPAMLAGGWGMTLGGAWETVINRSVTTGFEVDADIPVVNYPVPGDEGIQLVYGGLRLGALLGSDQIFHGLFNNTVGVGLTGRQTFLIDEISVGGEVNITRSIRAFAGAGYRYTYGVNSFRGLEDAGMRGLFVDAGLRYGEIGR